MVRVDEDALTQAIIALALVPEGSNRID
jgi:hypothetical protein